MKRILARIIGALFSDGSLYEGKKHHYYESSFCLGSKHDVRELCYDLSELGQGFRINKRTQTRTVNGRIFKMRSIQVKCVSKEFFMKLKELGVPVGKKSDINYLIPNWIMKSNRELRREFLSGFLGGDGPKATIFMQKRKEKAICNSYKLNDIEFYKRLDLTENGYEFANQLANILEENGVRVMEIFNRGKFPRKNGTRSTSIHIKISQSFDSILAYCKIPFSYCSQKRKANEEVLEFMEKIHQLRKQWKIKHSTALNLYKQNNSIKDIAKEVGVNYGTAFGWLKQNKKPAVGYHHLKFRGEQNDNCNRRKF